MCFCCSNLTVVEKNSSPHISCVIILSAVYYQVVEKNSSRHYLFKVIVIKNVEVLHRPL